MKIRMHLDLDLASGDYDLHCENASRPELAVDLGLVAGLAGRVMAQVAQQAEQGTLAPQPAAAVSAAPRLGWSLPGAGPDSLLN